MLTFFSVENFMNFKEKIEWDLKKTCNYEFNENAIRNKTVSKGLIYGYNGSGKSNFVLAVFDIITHLTDNRKHTESYELYTNLFNQMDYTTFCYKFDFDGHTVSYEYKKTSLESLVEEKLEIDDRVVISYDYITQRGKVELEGAQNLQLSALNPELSRVKAIKSSVILAINDVNRTYMAFMSFVERMLMFYTLDNRGYQGFRVSSENIPNGIVASGRLQEFQDLLHENNLFYELVAREVDNKMEIRCKFGDKEVNLFSIASTGTRSLALFFYWYIQMNETSFVIIDEFDAFYHYELAECIVKKLKEQNNCQIFLTTHNTDLLSNDLLRPDCYFEICENSIKALSDKTEKELRKAHNLQKMYKAGAFYEE